MLTNRRNAAVALFIAVFLASAAYWTGPALGGKGKQPPPDVDRPIVFWNSTKQDSAWRLTDVAGTSEAFFKVGGDLTPTGRARWSPDGLMIGGHNAYLGNSAYGGPNFGILVGTPDGTSEYILMTTDEFHAWNLSRPGVVDSRYSIQATETCWLGNGAIIFPALTTYDASLFGGNPGDTVEARRLYIADAAGNIEPLTESATFDGTTLGDTNPHWAAALNKVVFVGSPVAAVQGVGELYAINPDGTGLTQITDFGFSMVLYGPVWSPAGDRILFLARDTATNAYDLLIIGVDLSQPNPGMGPGGRVTALEPFKIVDDYDARGCWSPDGRDIVFSRYAYNRNGRRFYQLLMADSITGEETVIRSSDRWFGFPDCRPVP